MLCSCYCGLVVVDHVAATSVVVGGWPEVLDVSNVAVASAAATLLLLLRWCTILWQGWKLRERQSCYNPVSPKSEGQRAVGCPQEESRNR